MISYRTPQLLPQFISLLIAMCSVGASFQSAIAQTRWSQPSNSSYGFGGAGADWQGSNWLGGSTGQATKWRLGVTGDNLDTGVLVRDVASNSSAARARIEAGDIIVTVGGFQVGLVAGRLYDLAEEITRRADTSGYIWLVIQDHRTRQLASVRVKLDDELKTSQNSLTGTLVYRERTPLPSDAIVTVQIENLSRPYYTVRNGQTSFRPVGGASIPFEIAYDPTYINSQDNYQVRAFVTSAGRTIMDTPQPQRVLTNGSQNQVQLQLAGLTTAGSGSVISAGYPNYNAIDDRLISMYRRYLNRDPTALELAALRATPGIANRLDTMPMELMAAQEYFDAAGNNNSVWLDAVFQEIVKRKASYDELQQWMQRYADLRYSRTELLRQLYSQVKR